MPVNRDPLPMMPSNVNRVFARHANELSALASVCKNLATGESRVSPEMVASEAEFVSKLIARYAAELRANMTETAA